MLKVNALEQNTHFPSLSGAKLLLCGGYFSAFCRGKAETAQLCFGSNHCCLQKDGLLKGLQTSWTKKNPPLVLINPKHSSTSRTTEILFFFSLLTEFRVWLNQKQLQEFETDATLNTGHRPGRPRCPAEIRLWTSLWFAESVSVENMKFCPRTRVGMTAKGLSCF